MTFSCSYARKFSSRSAGHFLSWPAAQPVALPSLFVASLSFGRRIFAYLSTKNSIAGRTRIEPSSSSMQLMRNSRPRGTYFSIISSSSNWKPRRRAASISSSFDTRLMPLEFPSLQGLTTNGTSMVGFSFWPLTSFSPSATGMPAALKMSLLRYLFSAIVYATSLGPRQGKLKRSQSVRN